MTGRSSILTLYAIRFQSQIERTDEVLQIESKISKISKRVIVNCSALLAGIVGWAISFASIFKTGLGWDSFFDLSAAEISLKNSNLTNLGAYYDVVPITSEFYGTFIYKISDWLSLKLINTSIFSNLNSISNFYFVDIVTWFLSLIAVITICGALYLTFESSRYSFVYFGIMSTLPIWVGMSQVNSKDIPVAAGISILSSGFMLLIKSKSSKKLFYLGIILSSLGCAIAVSVRPASVLILLSFLLVNLIIYLFVASSAKKISYLITEVSIIVSVILVVSLIILYYSNPIALSNLFVWIKDAVAISLNYPSVQPVRVLGKDFLSDSLPSWYVAAWVWAQLPVLTFLSFILGLFILVNQSILQKDWQKLFYFFPFGVQAFFVPLMMLFIQPNLYNGIRHIIFIYPALIIFVTITIERLCSNFERRFINNLTGALAILIISLNLFATYRWMPFSYAFINPISGLGNQRNWDLDYWGLSSREGLERLSDSGKSDIFVVMPDNSSSIPFGGKYLNELAGKGKPINLYVFIHWNHKIVEENCKIDFKIKRDLQILGMGGFCNSKFTEK
jgi:hypothetical protein